LPRLRKVKESMTVSGGITWSPLEVGWGIKTLLDESSFKRFLKKHSNGASGLCYMSVQDLKDSVEFDLKKLDLVSSIRTKLRSTPKTVHQLVDGETTTPCGIDLLEVPAFVLTDSATVVFLTCDECIGLELELEVKQAVAELADLFEGDLDVESVESAILGLESQGRRLMKPVQSDYSRSSLYGGYSQLILEGLAKNARIVDEDRTEWEDVFWGEIIDDDTDSVVEISVPIGSQWKYIADHPTFNGTVWRVLRAEGEGGGQYRCINDEEQSTAPWSLPDTKLFKRVK